MKLGAHQLITNTRQVFFTQHGRKRWDSWLVETESSPRSTKGLDPFLEDGGTGHSL